jgi:flavin-dependent dehydrogenase
VPYYTAIFDEEISDFYSWIIPKENYLLLGSALRPKDNTREKHELLKAKLTQLGFNFENRVRTEGAYIYRPKKASQFYVGRNGIALVGEAAGAISPSSAEGISYALKSALYLAQSLEEGIDGFLDRYKQKTQDIKLNLLIKNLKSPAMYNPFLRKLAMKSGLQSI